MSCDQTGFSKVTFWKLSMTLNPYESPATGEDGSDRSKWPLFVRLGLWGLPTRASAWSFCILSLLLAVGCVAYAIVDQRFIIGGALFLAALWYYLSIRWVDEHGRW